MNENAPHTTASDDRRLVAVPDPDASRKHSAPLSRLGVQSVEKGATFRPGETGPAGQPLRWVYMRVGSTIRYEIDIESNTLTIAIRDPKTGKSGIVVHKIDASQLDEIVAGRPVTIVFAYDRQRFVDETPEIDEWCATSGPKYTEELQARLRQINSVVKDFQEDRAGAEKDDRVHVAERAPKSAQPYQTAGRFADEEQSRYTDADETDIEFDDSMPEGVQIYDPISGKTFVGRRWVRPNEQTTLAALTSGGYRFATLEFRNGETATMMPNYTGRKMAIQIKTQKGMVSRVLDESANDVPIGPGLRFTAEMDSTLDGDRIVEGQMLSTPHIVVVVGVGPEAERDDLPYPYDPTLEKFRDDRPLPGPDDSRRDQNFGPRFTKSA